MRYNNLHLGFTHCQPMFGKGREDKDQNYWWVESTYILILTHDWFSLKGREVRYIQVQEIFYVSKSLWMIPIVWDLTLFNTLLEKSNPDSLLVLKGQWTVIITAEQVYEK